jgi:hypothetical protein
MIAPIDVIPHENETLRSVKGEGSLEIVECHRALRTRPPRPSGIGWESPNPPEKIEEVIELAVNVANDVDRGVNEDNIVLLMKALHYFQENPDDASLRNRTLRIAGNPSADRIRSAGR